MLCFNLIVSDWVSDTFSKWSSHSDVFWGLQYSGTSSSGRYTPLPCISLSSRMSHLGKVYTKTTHTQITHAFSSESTDVKEEQQHWLTCISVLLAARMPTLESGSRCRLSVLSLFRKPCALCRVTCFLRLVSMTSRHCSTIAVSSFVPPAAHPTQQSFPSKTIVWKIGILHKTFTNPVWCVQENKTFTSWETDAEQQS